MRSWIRRPARELVTKSIACPRCDAGNLTTERSRCFRGPAGDGSWSMLRESRSVVSVPSVRATSICFCGRNRSFRRYRIGPMANTAKTSGRKVQALDRLVELVSEGGKRPELAKAATKMHRLIDFYDPPVGYIGRLLTIRSISDLAIGDVRFTSICR